MTSFVTTSSPPYITKDPNAVLDYTVDWSSWLSGGDTISSVSWSIPAGLTSPSNTFNNTTATVWLSGGTLDTAYTVVCHITTANGRQEDKTFEVRISNN